MKADLIGVLEASYQIEQSEEGWLSGLAHAAAPMLDASLGLISITYDASDPAAFRITSFAAEGIPKEAARHFFQFMPLADANFIRGSFLSLACGASTEIPGWYEQPGVDRARADFGMNDTLTINGVNPDGHGCSVIGLLSKKLKLTGRRRRTLAKAACHLAAAERLRRSLTGAATSPPAPEAILDRDGRVHHAEGEAKSNESRAELKRSALAITSARGSMRTQQPEQAIDEWKGLIAARWTLLDVSEKDGSKYLVARQNSPRTRGPNALTDREQEVVAFAAMGQHNKLIAYTLGISDSTVRVLIARAAKKLNAHSREELIERYAAYVREPA